MHGQQNIKKLFPFVRAFHSS